MHVPLGTQVFDSSGDVPIADLAHAKARVVIARGGRGGRGNRRFTTAVRQAPRTAEVGEDGESAELELRLKMVCDAALLGFPNAGKSSLLRRISNATPKVADYPFTTLAPHLGTVELDGQRQLTVADVPGLLEGASDGVGLGHAFLAHLERAHALVHVVAIDPEAGDPLADCRRRYAAIHAELAAHGGGLAERPQIVVLNKLDLVGEADGEALVRGVRRCRLARRAASRRRRGARRARDARTCSASPARRAPASPTCVARSSACSATRAWPSRPGRARRSSPTTCSTARAPASGSSGSCVTTASCASPGREVVWLVDQLDLATPAGVRALSIELGRLGVIDALRHAGVKPGHDVAIGDERFEFSLPPEEAVVHGDADDEEDDLEW